MPGYESEDFPRRLRRLASEAGLSVERVLADAWQPDVKGTSPNTVKAVLAGRRPLQPVQVETIARTLGVSPTEFSEYRLAKAREQLDERVIGLERALENLAAIAPLLSPTAAEEEALLIAEEEAQLRDERRRQSAEGGRSSGDQRRQHRAPP